MCGIAGIVDSKLRDHSSSIKKMTDVLHHRGPDGEGIWFNAEAGVWFGHRRLSIIDLSENGVQPMHYLGEKYTITFNGEIYNYVEIREKLIQKGYQFHSESDTEVLLALYDNKGKDCLSDLDGMFAFAIWDKEREMLFCARDRFGEKPFFYSYDGHRFVFASEMKALWAIGVEKRLALKRVADYVNHSLIYDNYSTDTTFYEQIFQLPNAHFLEIDVKKFELNIQPYYSLDTNRRIVINFEEAKSEFYRLFEQSVKRRLRSDVPVGTGLSGGLDSSSIVAMINRVSIGSSKRQSTFSARFDGFSKDEGKHIESVLKNFPGINHYNIWPSAEEFSEVVDKMIYYHEEPFGSTSIYAQWKVMEAVSKSNVKVLLDGQGSDESLAGYLYHYDRRMYYLFYTDYSTYKTERDAYFTLRQSNVPFRKLETVKTRVSGYVKRVIKYNNKPLPNLNDLLNRDVFYGSLQELLRYGDRNSMAHSVEVRTPFLYHELVEFVFSLPDEFKLYQGWTKFILRAAMEDELPKSITWRVDKVGYETPQERLIENISIAPRVDEYLKDHGLTPTSNQWKRLMLSKFI